MRPITLRGATADDSAAIVALVRGEHLNPHDLDWRRFVVATDGACVVGAVQLRRHADGSRELGSLVVRPDARGQGIAARMIDRLLAAESGRVMMVTRRRFAAYYGRWGFRRIEPAMASRCVRRNYRLGSLIGGLVSLLKGRRPVRLAILARS